VANRRRIIGWSIAVAAVMATLAASGLLQFGATGIAIVVQSLFPASVSWESPSAYVKCEGAIADASQWPKSPALACAAMNMCEAEASLSAIQRAALREAIRKTPGCR
jgi:hypothetical protein